MILSKYKSSRGSVKGYLDLVGLELLEGALQLVLQEGVLLLQILHLQHTITACQEASQPPTPPDTQDLDRTAVIQTCPDLHPPQELSIYSAGLSCRSIFVSIYTASLSSFPVCEWWCVDEVCGGKG